MTEPQKKHGGKRAGAGRPPKPTRKTRIYVEEKLIPDIDMLIEAGSLDSLVKNHLELKENNHLDIKPNNQDELERLKLRVAELEADNARIHRINVHVGSDIKKLSEKHADKIFKPRLLELQRQYDLEHAKNLDLEAKLHSMQAKIDSVDRLKAQVAEAEKLAHTRLGDNNKIRDENARLKRELKALKNKK